MPASGMPVQVDASESLDSRHAENVGDLRLVGTIKDRQIAALADAEVAAAGRRLIAARARRRTHLPPDPAAPPHAIPRDDDVAVASPCGFVVLRPPGMHGRGARLFQRARADYDAHHHQQRQSLTSPARYQREIEDSTSVPEDSDTLKMPDADPNRFASKVRIDTATLTPAAPASTVESVSSHQLPPDQRSAADRTAAKVSTVASALVCSE